MTAPASDAEFKGSVPEIYDRHLGPFLFEPYAAEVARRVRDVPVKNVLEVAAGTGILTRALRDTLPRDTRIVATDLNAPMVAYGARKVAADNVTWAQADGMSLSYADGEFDVVVCQFGAMFFPDRVRGFREALRVLAPGGRYIVAMWAPVEFSPVSQTVERAVAAVFPDDPPGFISRTPHGHGDPAVTQRELREAGFTEIRVEDVACTGRVRSALDPAIGFCQGSPLRGEILARDASRLDEVTQAVAARFGNGPFDAPLRAFVFTARA